MWTEVHTVRLDWEGFSGHFSNIILRKTKNKPSRACSSDWTGPEFCSGFVPCYNCIKIMCLHNKFWTYWSVASHFFFLTKRKIKPSRDSWQFPGNRRLLLSTRRWSAEMKGGAAPWETDEKLAFYLTLCFLKDQLLSPVLQLQCLRGRWHLIMFLPEDSASNMTHCLTHTQTHTQEWVSRTVWWRQDEQTWLYYWGGTMTHRGGWTGWISITRCCVFIFISVPAESRWITCGRG